jgi:DNA-directed RNA polymerase specialized sigma24 family protein
MTLRNAFDRDATAVYRLAFRHLGNREDAEDVTTRVLLGEARRSDPAVDEATRQRRLFDAVRAAIIDVWRRNGANSSIGLEWLLDDPAIPPDPSDQAARSMLTRVLQQLEPMERRVLELRLLQGRSLAEAEQELGTEELQTKALQQLALRRATEVARQGWGTRPCPQPRFRQAARLCGGP